MTTQKDNPTAEQIEKAYKIAAKIVALYGDAYLPVFQRLHNELEKIKQTEQIKTIALSVAAAIMGKD